ncbi:MAG: GNAT family N-acetyltransferase [Flavobacteriales bacterium]
MIPDSRTIDYPFAASSDRLLYRPVVDSDGDYWINFFNDPIAIKYFPTFQVDDAETNLKMWMDRVIDRYKEGLFGLHSLIEKSTGKYVGQCGLLTQEVDGKSELEIGYSLLREHWGKGYATEAATFMKQFAMENRLADHIVSLIHVDNWPSRKVAERNGMKVWKHSTWKELPIVVYRVNVIPD